MVALPRNHRHLTPRPSSAGEFCLEPLARAQGQNLRQRPVQLELDAVGGVGVRDQDHLVDELADQVLGLTRGPYAATSTLAGPAAASASAPVISRMLRW